MELNSLLLISFLLVLVIGYLAVPFYQETHKSFVKRNVERSHWLAERERILELLTDLDMDFEMGKFTEDRYKQERQNLLLKGAEYLKILEDLDKQPANLKKEKGKSGEDEIEKIIARRKEVLQASGSHFCKHCGNNINKGDRFCVNCGKPVKLSK